jgi:ADP-ribose pyrophosphatase YjhB (NUDIX family)
MLEATTNRFGGKVVGPESLPSSAEELARELAESTSAWRSEGAPLVWLELPISRAALVPVAVAAGFVYHHATEHTLHLTLRLVPGAYVPPDATHYVGAGGVVLTDDRRLLVVSEKHHKKKHLKLPGGALHPGEHIADAVIREVLEETGVRTRFVSLVCFRHWHGYRQEKSDIYFVTRLEPLSFDLRPDPSEIEECFWMPLDEYLSSPHTHPFNRRIVEAAMRGAREGDGTRVVDPLRPLVIDGYGTPETHELFFPDMSE